MCLLHSPAGAADPDRWHLACIWGRLALGREEAAVVAVPMTLFLLGQMKGGGLWQEQSSVPAEKVRLWGRPQLPEELFIRGGGGRK